MSSSDVEKSAGSSPSNDFLTQYEKHLNYNLRNFNDPDDQINEQESCVIHQTAEQKRQKWKKRIILGALIITTFVLASVITIACLLNSGPHKKADEHSKSAASVLESRSGAAMSTAWPSITPVTSSRVTMSISTDTAMTTNLVTSTTTNHAASTDVKTATEVKQSTTTIRTTSTQTTKPQVSSIEGSGTKTQSAASPTTPAESSVTSTSAPSLTTPSVPRSDPPTTTFVTGGWLGRCGVPGSFC